MEHSIQDHGSCAILEQTKPIDSQTDSSMAAATAAATESKPSFPWLDMIHAKLQYLAQAATKAVRAEDFSAHDAAIKSSETMLLNLLLEGSPNGDETEAFCRLLRGNSIEGRALRNLIHTIPLSKLQQCASNVWKQICIYFKLECSKTRRLTKEEHKRSDIVKSALKHNFDAKAIKKDLKRRSSVRTIDSTLHLLLDKVGFNVIFNTSRSGRPREYSLFHEFLVLGLVLTTVPPKTVGSCWTAPDVTKVLTPVFKRENETDKQTYSRVLSYVKRTLSSYGIALHKTYFVCVSSDPEFLTKALNVSEKYYQIGKDPSHLTICVDEKTCIQALYRTTGICAPCNRNICLTGVNHEYTRLGTTHLFGALITDNGLIFHQFKQTKDSISFCEFLMSLNKYISKEYPQVTTVDLVLDNYATHKTQQVMELLASKDFSGWALNFTPTHASWLNLVEGAFGRIARKYLRNNQSFKNLDELELIITAGIQGLNKKAHRINWTQPKLKSSQLRDVNGNFEQFGSECFPKPLRELVLQSKQGGFEQRCKEVDFQQLIAAAFPEFEIELSKTSMEQRKAMKQAHSAYKETNRAYTKACRQDASAQAHIKVLTERLNGIKAVVKAHPSLAPIQSRIDTIQSELDSGQHASTLTTHMLKCAQSFEQVKARADGCIKTGRNVCELLHYSELVVEACRMVTTVAGEIKRIFKAIQRLYDRALNFLQGPPILHGYNDVLSW